MQVLNGWSTKGQVIHAEKASTGKLHHVACDDWPSSLHSEHEPTHYIRMTLEACGWIIQHTFISLCLVREPALRKSPSTVR